MKQSIFSYLTSYVPTDKRESKEDYLTQMFAWILENVDGFGMQYIKFLCEKNKSIPCPQENQMNLRISTQETLPDGRIDMLIRTGSASFICEHKIYSSLSTDQIKKYMDNSQLLGPGKYYSVLVTYSTLQHTQPADVSLTWSDICEMTEKALPDYEHEDAFVLQQFIGFLKENGMGKAEPIKPEAMLGYWPAIELEEQLTGIFQESCNEDWSKKCPGIEKLSDGGFHPTFHTQHWGRLGIDFYDNWTPGVFCWSHASYRGSSSTATG